MISALVKPEDLEALRVWAGRGTGEICSGCGKPIEPSEVEYEVEVSSDSSLRFHMSCHDAFARR
jgi:methionyl-tRNA synthetase